MQIFYSTQYCTQYQVIQKENHIKFLNFIIDDQVWYLRIIIIEESSFMPTDASVVAAHNAMPMVYDTRYQLVLSILEHQRLGYVHSMVTFCSIIVESEGSKEMFIQENLVLLIYLVTQHIKIQHIYRDLEIFQGDIRDEEPRVIINTDCHRFMVNWQRKWERINLLTKNLDQIL